MYYAWDVIGQMKISPDGEKLALALYGSSIAEIFDFDNVTGRISNPVTINELSEPYSRLYGVEFSPDSQFLYVSDAGAFIYQIVISKLLRRQITMLGKYHARNGKALWFTIGTGWQDLCRPRGLLIHRYYQLNVVELTKIIFFRWLSIASSFIASGN